MAHIEILVEEPSAEAALEILVPRIVPTVSFAIHPHQDKRELLDSLPRRLRGYARWMPRGAARVMVLVDADADDCRDLKTRLEAVSRDVGLETKSSHDGARPAVVVHRIAVEELEAWFFGDVPALCAAFPGIPATLGARRRFRDPDAIRGGSWETLRWVLRSAGSMAGGFEKIATARAVAAHMDPQRNRSGSFRRFREALVWAAEA